MHEVDKAEACTLRRRNEAAKYLSEVWRIPTSPNYLAKLATVGGGPCFRKAGNDGPLGRPRLVQPRE